MPRLLEMMRRQQVLADFGEFAIRSEDLDEVLNEACRLVAEALGTARAKVLEIQDCGKELFVRAGVGWPDNVVGKVRLQMSDRSSETYSINVGGPVISQDTAKEDRFVFPDFMKNAGVVALVNVPIFVPGRSPYGVLQVDASEPREFGDDEIQFLRTYATILGPVIDRLRKVRILRTSQERFRRIVETARDYAIFTTDAVDRIDGWFPGAEAVFGWSADEAIGQLGSITFTPEDRAAREDERELQQARREGSAANVRWHQRKDGSRIFIEGTTWALHDEAGMPYGFVKVGQDVTERRRASDALAEREADLAAKLRRTTLLHDLAVRLVTAESLPTMYADILSVAVAIAEADTGTVQTYNPVTKTLELLATQGLERSLTDQFQRVDAGSSTACGIALRTGKRTLVDYEHDEEDDSCRKHVEAGLRSGQATPLLARDGSPIGMINTHWRASGHRPSEDQLRSLDLLARQTADLIEQRRADVALRESEERQRALIEGVPQLVWRAVNAGRWTWASPQWTILTGQAQEDSRGWGWLDPVHPDDRDVAREAWAHAAERGHFEAEYRICAYKTGTYRWFQTRAEPMRNEESAIVEWLGTSTDVDDLRTLQDRQQVLVAELQHRTFNLMSIVRSTADATIRSSATLEDFKSMFRDRIDALARVQRLLSRLKGDYRVTFEELIRSELDAVGVLKSDADRVTLDGPPGVALRSGTVQTLAMALHELTTNAVKYGAFRYAGAHLNVCWRTELRKGQPWLHIMWRETGVPMPPTDAPPLGTGQGRRLIEEALPYQLKAETTYFMAAEGVRCSIALPVSSQSLPESFGTA